MKQKKPQKRTKKNSQIVFSVKDVCKNVKCGHGSCTVKSTPPFYECKCKPPYRPPDCKKGAIIDFIKIFHSHFIYSLAVFFWQPLPAGPILVKMGVLAWRVPNAPVSNVPALTGTVEPSVKSVNPSYHGCFTYYHPEHTSLCWTPLSFLSFSRAKRLLPRGWGILSWYGERDGRRGRVSGLEFLLHPAERQWPNPRVCRLWWNWATQLLQVRG